MPKLILKAIVPRVVPEVYEHVTAYSANGAPEMAALTAKYGRLQTQSGEIYTFQEEGDPWVTWQCTFNPPHSRVMSAPEARWSNRTDYFQPVDAGTYWTIVWETKGYGVSRFIQWFAFQLKHRREARRRIVQPVLEHFRRVARGSGFPGC